MKGRITTIKRAKGFGFIQGEDGVDRFFHVNSVDTPFEQLQEGIDVTFEPYEESVHPKTKEPIAAGKGLRARRVTAAVAPTTL